MIGQLRWLALVSRELVEANHFNCFALIIED
jgi:hypothetical protein